MFSVTNWLLPNEVAVPPPPANRLPRSPPDLAGQSALSPWILTVGRRHYATAKVSSSDGQRSTLSVQSCIRVIKASAVTMVYVDLIAIYKVYGDLHSKRSGIYSNGRREEERKIEREMS